MFSAFPSLSDGEHRWKSGERIEIRHLQSFRSSVIVKQANTSQSCECGWHIRIGPARDIQRPLDRCGARAERWHGHNPVLRLGGLGLGDAVEATAAKTGWPWGIVRDGFGRFSDYESCKKKQVRINDKNRTTRGCLWRVPFIPACFSPCLPNPRPFDFSSPSEVSARFPPKRERRNLGVGRSPVCMGSVPAPAPSPALQTRMLRLGFACSRKMRPSVMFKQATEKRKNAATSANSSTWCDRIAAPILKNGRSARSELSCDEHGKNGKKRTYSPWKIPSEPRPNCEPSTGKKRSKKDIGHEISDRMRKTSWKMMKR